MGRKRFTKSKEQLKPDPRYDSKVVSKEFEAGRVKWADRGDRLFTAEVLCKGVVSTGKRGC